MNTEEIVYDNCKVSDLFREIKTRSDIKKEQLDAIFIKVLSHITDKNDVMMLMPRLKEILEVGVKNDEQLLKLVSVFQKVTNISSNQPGELLSDAEKEQLLKMSSEIESLGKEILAIPTNLEFKK